MKIIIADDEPLARSRLRRLIEGLPDHELLAEVPEGAALLDKVAELRPDVVLVDIHMPGMDGLHAARKLSELDTPPAIIFTTAHSEHAVSAFGTLASGYLLKPIRQEQLATALMQARQRTRAQMNAEPSATEHYIEVRERERHIRVPLSRVIFCLSEDKYTRLVWEGGEHIIDVSLRQLEESHPDELLRVHRKVLVAPSAILGLEKHVTGLRLLLRGSTHTPPVSRRLAASVRALIKSDNP